MRTRLVVLRPHSLAVVFVAGFASSEMLHVPPNLGLWLLIVLAIVLVVTDARAPFVNGHYRRGWLRLTWRCRR